MIREDQTVISPVQNETPNTTEHGIPHTTKRFVWIDCLKFFSVMAVFVDHTTGLLHTNPIISYASFFSVSVFVFLAGVTSYPSNIKSMPEPWKKDIVRRLKRLLIPYAIATACHLLYANHVLDLQAFFSALIHFNASVQFYFMAFFLQLMLISRLLAKLVAATAKSKYAPLLYALELIASVLISVLCMQYTLIPSIYGGGAHLLGGTYFTLFFAGMIYSKLQETRRSNILRSSILCVIFLCGIIFWVPFMARDQLSIDVALKYFGGFNPPGISFFIYAFLVIGFVRNLDDVLERINFRVLNFIRSVIGKLGQYSLYIFLFHLLAITILLNIGMDSLGIGIWMQRIIYIVSVIVSGYVAGVVIEWIMKKLNGKALNEKVDSES